MTSTSTVPSIAVQLGDAPIGAEIVGVDLSAPLADSVFADIRRAYDTHSVIYFRGQRLTPETQVRFSRRFGELEIHVLKHFLLEGYPEILVVSNIEENGRQIGLADTGRTAVWHTDMSYLKMPSAGSALYAVEVPVDASGRVLGDTLFASTVAAYQALDAAMKKRLAGLKAIHHMTKGYDNDRGGDAARIRYSEVERVPDVAHPIVRTHLATGRKCIYINKLCTTGIEGMAQDEADELLEFLYSHCTRPEFIYRHRWQAGDLLMWDNCTAQHLAVPDYAPPLRRRMHRTTLRGSIPV